MLSRFFNSSTYPEESFLEELLKDNFNKDFLLKLLKDKKVNINFLDKDGNSFLNNCILNSNEKASLWLLEQNIDPTLENNSKQISLNLALKIENSSIVKMILNHEKIDINEKDINGRIILQDLVVEGNLKMSKLLIENGADINSKDKQHRNVIFDALSYGDESFIMSLLDLEQDIELNNIDSDLNTIMHHSEVALNHKLAKKLIEAGADTTIKNIKGESFLCKLALDGDTNAKELVKLALENGADANSRNDFDNTMLLELMNAFSLLSINEVKRRKNLLDMSKLIMEYGADVDAINFDNETALFKAIRIKDIELVSFLLVSNINPNIINKYGETVLSEAVCYGIENLDIIILLLKYNADPLIKNAKGQTIYEVLNNIILFLHNKKALNNKKFENKLNKYGQYMVIVKELLKHNKKSLNFLDSTGNPLFFNPLLYDDGQLFRLYINNDLNIHLVNKSKHNIFFAYVIKVFEDNNTEIDFQGNLSRLISKKVNQNYQDSLGWTVIHKILSTKCNMELFNILIKIVKFDLAIVDNLGRSIMHNAVWHNNQTMIRRMNAINKSIINIADSYGLLPITYAALLGSQELVLLFIELKVNMKGGHNIPLKAIKKFSPMLKNLPKIKENIDNPLILEKIDTLIYQTQVDFNVPEFLILK